MYIYMLTTSSAFFQMADILNINISIKRQKRPVKARKYTPYFYLRNNKAYDRKIIINLIANTSY